MILGLKSNRRSCPHYLDTQVPNSLFDETKPCISFLDMQVLITRLDKKDFQSSIPIEPNRRSWISSLDIQVPFPLWLKRALLFLSKLGRFSFAHSDHDMPPILSTFCLPVRRKNCARTVHPATHHVKFKLNSRSKGKEKRVQIGIIGYQSIRVPNLISWMELVDLCAILGSKLLGWLPGKCVSAVFFLATASGYKLCAAKCLTQLVIKKIHISLLPFFAL